MTSDDRVPVFAVAWYRENQWGRLLELAADRDALEDTYTQWRQIAETNWRRLLGMGVNARRVDIDIELLWSWCCAEGRPLDGEARSEFAARCAQASPGDGSVA